tara:strand:- start:2690 stop:2998 length:309 start_codon:yes stop_codon:yes gene_type:complete
MPRHGRCAVIGHPQHIIARGSNLQAIFSYGEDYSVYFEILKAGCVKYSAELHSYGLMPRYIHPLRAKKSNNSDPIDPPNRDFAAKPNIIKAIWAGPTARTVT